MASPKPHRAFAKLTTFTATPFERANKQFALEAAHPDWSLEDLFGDAPETVFVHAGSVEHEGDLALRSSGDTGLYVIHGDLDVGGTLSFVHADGGAVLRVTGTVRAQHLAIAHDAHLWIGKDLKLAGQLVDMMSDGGGLRVGGKTIAKTILALGRGSSRSLAGTPKCEVRDQAALAAAYAGKEPDVLIKALAQGKALLAAAGAKAAPSKSKRTGVEEIKSPYNDVWTLARAGDRMYTGGEWSMYWFGEADKQVTKLETGPEGVKRRVYGVDDTVVTVGEDGVGLRFSTDRGKTWRAPIDAEGPTCLTRAADGTFWLAGNAGFLRSSKTLAGPWQRHDFDGDKYDVDRVSDVAVVGKRVLLAHAGLAHVDGKKVIPIKTPTKQQLTRLVSLPSGTIIAIGDKATILRSTDAGVTWKKIASPVSGDFEDALWLDGALYLVGGKDGAGVVVRSRDDGERFEQLGPTLPQKMSAIAGWGSDFVIAGGGQVLYRYRGAEP